MNTKLEFHGSDIEKVCEHYGLKKEDIVNFDEIKIINAMNTL